MRQVTQKAVAAFMEGRNFKMGNTSVETERGKIMLSLHGNLIAVRYENGEWANSILITNAKWQTNTTKERLNGLPGVSVCQKKGEWYLNGHPWNGQWAKIKLS